MIPESPVEWACAFIAFEILDLGLVIGIMGWVERRKRRKKVLSAAKSDE